MRASERLQAMIGDIVANELLCAVRNAEIVEDCDDLNHLVSMVLPDSSDDIAWDKLCSLIDSYNSESVKRGKGVYFILEPIN